MEVGAVDQLSPPTCVTWARVCCSFSPCSEGSSPGSPVFRTDFGDLTSIIFASRYERNISAWPLSLSSSRDDPGESDMKTFIPSPRRDERVYGLTRPRDIPNTLEDTAGRYSPPILEPTAADEDDDEWNLDRVPTNENVRPRYFTRVKAPDGEEHVPMIEPDGLAAPRVIPAACV